MKWPSWNKLVYRLRRSVYDLIVDLSLKGMLALCPLTSAFPFCRQTASNHKQFCWESMDLEQNVYWMFSDGLMCPGQNRNVPVITVQVHFQDLDTFWGQSWVHTTELPSKTVLFSLLAVPNKSLSLTALISFRYALVQSQRPRNLLPLFSDCIFSALIIEVLIRVKMKRQSDHHIFKFLIGLLHFYFFPCFLPPATPIH